ncbi:LysR family transcriptional regulator [Actimicrobium antarcticum]|uniref:LysR family transcriptional regulator n=1 Tax=Actimicrobium antarcticum TaxID=1051899 RepID=A0ABP7T0N9_9BURK
MHLTLRQLQIFLAVAQTGSTTAAAALVALSQSATSAALNELESQLALRLFDRVGKKLILNDSGRVLLPQARQLLDAAAHIEQQFQVSDPLSAAGLRIGASTTIGSYLLPAIFAAAFSRAARAYPRVTIANTAQIVTAISNVEVDLGLLEGPTDDPDLVLLPWIDDELVIVAAPDHPILSGDTGSTIAIDALQAAGWLLRESGSGTRETVDQALRPHLPGLRSVGEFGNSEAVKHGAAEGLGLACLSRCVVSDLIGLGRLVELRTALPVLRRQFYLAHSRHKILSPRLRHFLTFCQGWVR